MVEFDGSLEGALVAGKYRVKRRIGAGGMGAVYEGEHVEIGKRVAIKVIGQEHGRSDEIAARFRREARAASAVESEHIVQVFDVGRDESIGLFMVMEYLDGEDLSSRLEKAGGRIPVEEAVTIVTQAARALGKAHAAGVVHRDIKPANLYLTAREDGSASVKILDFGISKLVRPESNAKSSSLTREGSVMGTLMYMSPEQAQGLAVDGRSDIWSLASVLYEALAGCTPYESRDTYEQMIVQIVTKKPRPMEEIAPWVPAPIVRVIESALAHDVANRTPDAASFANSLTEAVRLAGDLPSGLDATVLAPPTPSSARIAASAPASGGASPPTGTGVVVGARTEVDAGIPRKRGPALMIAVAFAAIVGAAGALAVVARTPAPTSVPPGGLVASPASEPPVASGAPSALAAPAPTTVITNGTGDPAATAGATATATVSAPIAPPSPKTRALLDAGARPITRPRTVTAPPATTTKVEPSQYGAAGVSTAY